MSISTSCFILPGVPTTHAGRRFIARPSSATGKPPKKQAHRSCLYRPLELPAHAVASVRNTSAICIAISLVGATHIAFTEEFLSSITFSSATSSPFVSKTESKSLHANATVFPVPDFASIRQSLPNRSKGIAETCTGDGYTNPHF